jgi:oligopeptide transport system substrate-binding protein
LAVLVLALASCGGGDGDGEAAPTGSAPEQVLRVNFGGEPPSLDPGLATDLTSANVLNAITDPLVQLGDDLQPAPSLAERWEVSEDGKTVTLHVRRDGKWTNGDPVTAHDFEYSWKRTLDPELAADYAYQFYGIAGAAEYNGCEKNCARLREAVGVKALDDYTLEVRLVGPQPWFLQQIAHHSFRAVHRATVERYREKWTAPENIVTNGPFKLQSWEHEASMTFVKNEAWRGAASVKLERIEGLMIRDATTALLSFEAGEFDACIDQATCIPTVEFERLADSPDLRLFPGLAVQYIGLNVENVPDVNQRRALALAIDRQEIVDNVSKAGEVPATGFTPKGIPGFEQIEQSFLSPRADMERARVAMSRAKAPKTRLQLFLDANSTARARAIAVQSMWAELGIETTIKAQEWAGFLEFIGPPPNKAVDAIDIAWVGDYVDAINFLELAECDSGFNFAQFCDPEFDRLLDRAREMADAEERYALYGQAEARLTGAEGGFPYLPLCWGVYAVLAKENVQGWEPNLLDQFDFTQVSIEAS